MTADPRTELVATRVLIDEHLDNDGTPRRVWLETDGEALSLRRDEAAVAAPLPAGALALVMRRYGRPLEDGLAMVVVEELTAEGGVLRRVQFRAAVDAASRDWLVWQPPAGGEALAALATAIATPLLHLTRIVRR